MNRNQLLLNLTICLPMKKLLTHTYDVILSMCAHIYLNMLKRCILDTIRTFSGIVQEIIQFVREKIETIVLKHNTKHAYRE